MEPAYFIENRYSPIVDFQFFPPSPTYEVDTPETAFERDVQTRLAVANRLLMAGKFASALAKYEDLRALISRTLRPELGLVGSFAINWAAMPVAEMSEALIAKSASILKAEPLAKAALPDAVLAEEIKLADGVAKPFEIASGIGLGTRDKKVGVLLDEAAVNIKAGENATAVFKLREALADTEDPRIKAAIRHDIAVVEEQDGNRDDAIRVLEEANEELTGADDVEGRAAILATLVGMQARNNARNKANSTLNELRELRGITVVRPREPAARGATGAFTGFAERSTAFDFNRRGATIARFAERPALSVNETLSANAGTIAFRPIDIPDNIEEAADATATLIAADAFAARKTTRTLSVLEGSGEVRRVALDDNAAANLTKHYNLIRTTSDITLLTAWIYSPTHTIAYLTHVTQWVIPVAIGDCHAALGSYAAAETEYLRCLDYQFLNEVVEVVTLWVRLAELYVEWGDQLYRQARNDVSRFAQAREKYEQVITIGDEVNDSSPLYASPRFQAIRTRAVSIINNLFITAQPNTDNPKLALAIARARMQIRKIDAELNYIGLGVYVPPFSFEYLQNIARYFAQHASQVEQMYIQFQSTGENEELRAQQMAQQVYLAEASEELERRGLDEARAGVDVARANRDAAQQQLSNAQQAAAAFDAVRGQLLDLAVIQAWSSAAAVDEDDEVRQTTLDYGHFHAVDERRSKVLQDLAYHRGRISNDLEAARLAREIAAADAYRDVANAQIDQAQARVDVARQRIQIARLQKNHAEDNLNFLKSKEFTAAMWYDMAREARRITRRYLDAAIEIATLMEKAYEAETGRDLRKIKFEYGLDHINGLLGAEALLLDIDYFTLDHARTRSKRAPMRQSISVADNFPVAFEQLLSTGTAMFETTLEHFERRYPGFYLQKVKQVEVRVVGLTGTEGLHGTLRNVGLSQVRHKSGGIENQIYPGDVMPLSEYDVRHDAIVFQHDPKDLRLFENNGVATMWRLDLPLATNTFDLRHILDVQLIISYDGFFDAGLESTVVATLPTSSSASNSISLRLYAPDELFFLRANGSCGFALTPNLFPANQINQVLTGYHLRVQGAAAAGLTLTVEFENLGQSHSFTLDADGRASGADFAGPIGQSLFENLAFSIDPAANPGVDLSQIEDLQLVVEYDFDYRS